MINKTVKIILLITLLVGGVGCGKKAKIKKLPGQYIDLMKEISYAQPSEELANKSITVPGAVVNNEWLNSNFSLVSIPENIKIEPALANKSATYKLLQSKNIYGASVTPVVEAGVMYVSDNRGHALAYRLDQLNKPIWTVKITSGDEHDFAGGGLALGSGKVAVTFGSQNLVVLNQENGEELWRYSLSNIARSAPAIKDGKLFVLTIDNRLYCIDLNNGAVLWTHEGATEQFGVFGFASPVVTEKFAIVPHSSGQLMAIDIKNGQMVWQVSLIKNMNNNTMLYLNDLDMTPIINHGVIYLSNYAGVMFAIDLDNGQIKWANDTVGGNKYAWIAGDFIYAANRYNQLVAVLKQTGEIKWVQDLADTDMKAKKKKVKIAFSGPIMVNSMLYIIASNGRMLVFDPVTGSMASEHKAAKSVYSPPIAVGNALYFISNSGVLSAIR